ncbi:MAG: UvrB/UvrC motif-containing protein [Planctomycetota bacterium]|jgi:protein arginine kinase activator
MGKLCQYCNKREAKIHFTEIKDGKQTEMHICEGCAHEKNVELAFPSLLSHIVKGGPAGAGRTESDAVPASCPKCGLAYSEFKSKGRLGCGACYDAFAPVLVPLLEKVHGAASHTGHVPERAAAPEPEAEPPPPPVPDTFDEAMVEPGADDEVARLEAELHAAIAAEEYERAAALRDEIRELKEDSK